MPASKIVDEQEVIRWFNDGLTYPEMQKLYWDKYQIKTTAPMWSSFRRRRGLDRRNLRADDLLPWRMKEEHRHQYPPIMLRIEARLREEEAALGRGEEPRRPVSDRDKKRLDSWKKGLKADGQDLVVHYDPDTEEGFFLVPRRPEDSDLIRNPPRKTGNQARD
ncbi:hypothetical protein J7E99_28425 [Streptomyces sp. ISL-44]|uniref:hypothetical protein n=1 Tax=Streptomyces sp. ISL-44 TaxID=2819184 RepID=UPI001BE63DB0|nr:hypothetical protein [Streptomyces sp. ISL-44]MBT2544519.1 hypothetical protein [Streptomyces sp. ISL-44]